MRARERGQRGFALLLTVLVLLLVASLGLSALNVVETDQRVAGYLNRKRISLYAADAGVARAMETLQNNGTPSVPSTPVGDTSVFPHGAPSYSTDTSVATPIESIGVSALGGMNLKIQDNNQATFQLEYWRVSVQGDAPGETVSRVEFVTGKLLAN